ncbi:hypothetical protein PCASD_06943 [Puccinia coronata f. sp. avenae]|uniref:F-box domain-containing protein n=1 Tax=Puccinia coronata f. sp. avenae TaxID=200324 RepID=A0A2N5V556_9BASI|nr:hypothetical protein PCASD_06943 [Puccinia coronata f. sp. avenae]
MRHHPHGLDRLLTRSKRAERAHVITQLRLVCRRWADWLYSNHLYDVIYIGSNQSQSHHQASAFVEEFTRRSITLPPPRCRYLKVVGLWTLGCLSRNKIHTKIEAQHLEDLVRLFSNTIVTLDIQVVNFFTLPMRTIEQIGRIPNLQMLRLGIQFTKNGAAQLTAISGNPRPIAAHISTDSDCLVTLLRAAAGVVYLDMTDFRPVCSLETLEENLGDFQFTEIQTLKLDVKIASNLTIDEVGAIGGDHH